MVVSAANSAARKRPRTSDQGPRAVEDQAVQAAQRPGGPGPRNSEENGSEPRANADANGLTAVDLEEADLEAEADFDDLDADDADLAADADLSAELVEEDLDDVVLADVVEVADVLVVDDGPGPEGPEDAEDLDEPAAASQPSAADGPPAAAADAAAGQVVKLSPDGGGEDEEYLVFSDDDEDLPAAQVAVAGATADPVKDYLKQIGKVPLLNAEQEVELAKRIEAGLFAEEKLADGAGLSTDARIDLEWISEDGTRASLLITSTMCTGIRMVRA